MIKEKFIFDLQRFDGDADADGDGDADGDSDSTFSGGSGSQTDPYLISTVADLQQLATDVNGGNSYSDKYFKLANDIDLKDVENFTAIGWYDEGTSTYYNFSVSSTATVTLSATSR